jgi:hypothetical protein
MLVNVIMENPVNSGSVVLLFLASLSIAAVSEQLRSHGTGRLTAVQKQNPLSDFVVIWKSFCRFVKTFISTIEHVLRGADAIDRAYRKVSAFF